jgi:general secretion pathway protein E
MPAPRLGEASSIAPPMLQTDEHPAMAARTLARPPRGPLDLSRFLSPAALERVRRVSAKTGERAELAAAHLGLLSEKDLASLFAAALGVAVVSPADMPPAVPPALAAGAAFLRKSRMVPLHDTPGGLPVAMADPFDDQSRRALAFALDRPVVPRPAIPADIDSALDRLFGRVEQDSAARPHANDDEAASADIDRLKDAASEAPVIRLVGQMIARAVELRASDIHVEATEAGLRVRYRIDGVLQEAEPPPAALRAAIVSRIKIMAKLDIAVRQLAQDGRIRLAVRGREVDFRVSTTPSVHGESVVLRVLDRSNLQLDFAALGFDGDLLHRFLGLLGRPHGVLLVTGPTGSGKTTTLYTALATLNAVETKILTVEDPVEYLLAGVNQVQVKPGIGLTFASALRSFLRQDPDVLMIGEIRDLETAQIAVQAALTGHLVLSSVHTNDAASAIARLLDMGVEDYLLTSTINGILAQRLVRTLCPLCRRAYEPGADLLRQLGLAADPGEAVFYRATGCASCNGRGYTGRTMILELLAVSDAIRSLVLQHAEARRIHQQAVSEGMQTMFVHGLAKARAGITSIEEVLRAVRDS